MGFYTMVETETQKQIEEARMSQVTEEDYSEEEQRVEEIVAGWEEAGSPQGRMGLVELYDDEGEDLLGEDIPLGFHDVTGMGGAYVRGLSRAERYDVDQWVKDHIYYAELEYEATHCSFTWKEWLAKFRSNEKRITSWEYMAAERSRLAYQFIVDKLYSEGYSAEHPAFSMYLDQRVPANDFFVFGKMVTARIRALIDEYYANAAAPNLAALFDVPDVPLVGIELNPGPVFPSDVKAFTNPGPEYAGWQLHTVHHEAKRPRFLGVANSMRLLFTVTEVSGDVAAQFEVKATEYHAMQGSGRVKKGWWPVNPYCAMWLDSDNRLETRSDMVVVASGHHTAQFLVLSGMKLNLLGSVYRTTRGHLLDPKAMYNKATRVEYAKRRAKVIKHGGVQFVPAALLVGIELNPGPYTYNITCTASGPSHMPMFVAQTRCICRKLIGTVEDTKKGALDKLGMSLKAAGAERKDGVTWIGQHVKCSDGCRAPIQEVKDALSSAELELEHTKIAVTHWRRRALQAESDVCTLLRMAAGKPEVRSWGIIGDAYCPPFVPLPTGAVREREGRMEVEPVCDFPSPVRLVGVEENPGPARVSKFLILAVFVAIVDAQIPVTKGSNQDMHFWTRWPTATAYQPQCTDWLNPSILEADVPDVGNWRCTMVGSNYATNVACGWLEFYDGTDRIGFGAPEIGQPTIAHPSLGSQACSDLLHYKLAFDSSDKAGDTSDNPLPDAGFLSTDQTGVEFAGAMLFYPISGLISAQLETNQFDIDVFQPYIWSHSAPTKMNFRQCVTSPYTGDNVLELSTNCVRMHETVGVITGSVDVNNFPAVQNVHVMNANLNVTIPPVKVIIPPINVTIPPVHVVVPPTFNASNILTDIAKSTLDAFEVLDAVSSVVGIFEPEGGHAFNVQGNSLACLDCHTLGFADYGFIGDAVDVAVSSLLTITDYATGVTAISSILSDTNVLIGSVLVDTDNITRTSANTATNTGWSGPIVAAIVALGRELNVTQRTNATCTTSYTGVSPSHRFVEYPRGTWLSGSGCGMIWNYADSLPGDLGVIEHYMTSSVRPVVEAALVQAKGRIRSLTCANFSAVQPFTTIVAMESDDPSCQTWKGAWSTPTDDFSPGTPIWLCVCPAVTATHMFASASVQRSSPSLSAKRRNKLMHAANGNSSRAGSEFEHVPGAEVKSRTSSRHSLDESKSSQLDEMVTKLTGLRLTEQQKGMIQWHNEKVLLRHMRRRWSEWFPINCWILRETAGDEVMHGELVAFEAPIDDITDERQTKLASRKRAAAIKETKERKPPATSLPSREGKSSEGKAGPRPPATVARQPKSSLVHEQVDLAAGLREVAPPTGESTSPTENWNNSARRNAERLKGDVKNLARMVNAPLPIPYLKKIKQEAALREAKTDDELLASIYVEHKLGPHRKDPSMLIASVMDALPKLSLWKKNIAWQSWCMNTLRQIPVSYPVLSESMEQEASTLVILSGQSKEDIAPSALHAILLDMGEESGDTAYRARTHNKAMMASQGNDVRAVEADAHNALMHASNGNTESKTMQGDAMTDSDSRSLPSIRGAALAGSSASRDIDPTAMITNLHGVAGIDNVPQNLTTYEGDVMMGTYATANGPKGLFGQQVPGSQLYPRTVRDADGDVVNAAARLRVIVASATEIRRADKQVLTDQVVLDVATLGSKGTNKEDVNDEQGTHVNDYIALCTNAMMLSSGLGQDMISPMINGVRIAEQMALYGPSMANRFPWPGEIAQHDPYSAMSYPPEVTVENYVAPNGGGEDSGGDLTFLPFGAGTPLDGQGSIAFHVSTTSVPPGEIAYMLPAPPGFIQSAGFGSPAQAIAILTAIFSPGPLWNDMLTVATTDRAGENKANTVYAHRISSFHVRGADTIHIVLGNVRSGKYPTTVAQANLMSVTGQPTSGPTESASMNPNQPLDISVLGDLRLYPLAEYLFSWFKSSTAVPSRIKSQHVWAMLSMIASMNACNQDLMAAIEFVAIHSVKYVPLVQQGVADGMMNMFTGANDVHQFETWGFDFQEQPALGYDFDFEAPYPKPDLWLPATRLLTVGRNMLGYTKLKPNVPFTDQSLLEYDAPNVFQLNRYRAWIPTVGWQLFFCAKAMPATFWDTIDVNNNVRDYAFRFLDLWRDGVAPPKWAGTIEGFIGATGYKLLRSSNDLTVLDYRNKPTTGFNTPKVWANDGASSSLGEVIPLLLTDYQILVWTRQAYKEMPLFAPANSLPGQHGISDQKYIIDRRSTDAESTVPLLQERRVRQYGRSEVPLADATERYNASLMLRAYQSGYFVDVDHNDLSGSIPGGGYVMCPIPIVDTTIPNYLSDTYAVASTNFFPCCDSNAVPVYFAVPTAGGDATFMSKQIAGSLETLVETIILGRYIEKPAEILGGKIEVDTEMIVRKGVSTAMSSDFTPASTSQAPAPAKTAVTVTAEAKIGL